MNREGFVPPTQSNLAAAAAGVSSFKNYGIKYVCASCAVPFTLGKNEPVRCKECGHRILYKARTRRMVQFEAR
ncbi:DNA-directed RNA polymerase core subunit RPC10 [Ascoidea rubescens DSM 1968]|uniref:DNA-directed RNA polymerase II subunit K n=1 Tax=Ascoidea rubescens DSM 1968 TaxID=1344418 RepID=A0A1D2VLL5_9ASCO|nr:DNA-directed RNA polymerase II subunit K [Ascoidea rubescens DSM 1968]ODV62499.1 DNA-directed RNA polymerase II subunit K [Ascoidea rubescens DSM 1968]